MRETVDRTLHTVFVYTKSEIYRTLLFTGRFVLHCFAYFHFTSLIMWLVIILIVNDERLVGYRNRTLIVPVNGFCGVNWIIVVLVNMCELICICEFTKCSIVTWLVFAKLYKPVTDWPFQQQMVSQGEGTKGDVRPPDFGEMTPMCLSPRFHWSIVVDIP
jgi:hypothetical protein